MKPKLFIVGAVYSQDFWWPASYVKLLSICDFSVAGRKTTLFDAVFLDLYTLQIRKQTFSRWENNTDASGLIKYFVPEKTIWTGSK